MADVDVVRIQVQTVKPGVGISITCTVLDNICHPLPRQPIQLAKIGYPHLADIRLADFHEIGDSESVRIDILLGGDYYYDFVTSECRRPSGRGPVAVKTTVGWVLGGPIVDDKESVNLSAVPASTTLLLQDCFTIPSKGCDTRRN